jgi:nucleoside 2-deoxyribosyltransferase
MMEARKKIYLACPYSHEKGGIRSMRFDLVNAAAAKLMREGYLVFSPISHTHPIAERGDLPKGWDFWEAYDRTFIDWADEVHVLMLDGWKESKGVTAEIAIAKELGKPVHYIEDKGNVDQVMAWVEKNRNATVCDTLSASAEAFGDSE